MCVHAGIDVMIEKTASVPWTFVLDEPVRILIVDDDALLCEFASVYLSSPCASIDIACGAAAGRLQLSQNAYDIVLLDIEMPDVDGFALLAEIRASEKHPQVIMLTGHDDITSIDRAYQMGANSFATKPVNWRQLSYQIRHVVRTTRASHAALEEAGPGPTLEGIGHDIQASLQIVIDRANALEERLSAHGEQWSELLRGVRSFTSLCRMFRTGPECRTGRAGQLTPADQCDAA
jgi:DNA-binding response OmpR family regulator